MKFSKCTNWTAKGVPVHDTKDWHKGKHVSVTRVKVHLLFSEFYLFSLFIKSFNFLNPRIKDNVVRAGPLPLPAQLRVPGRARTTGARALNWTALPSSKLWTVQLRTTTRVAWAATLTLVLRMPWIMDSSRRAAIATGAPMESGKFLDVKS